ncbi:MAG: hypothetical protein IJ542_00395 [Clostridia bacterium]|nr:hypothetical protein [Clostridia bacterium]
MKVSGEFNEGAKNSDNYHSKNTGATFFYAPNKISIQSQPKTENDLKHKSAKKNKAQDISKLITTFATMVSATVLGVVGVGALTKKPTITAKFQEVYAYESGVAYFLTLEGYNPGDDVYVVLHNDFTNRSQKVEEPEFQGVFENLQTNMTYTLLVKKGSTVLTSTKLRTVNQEDEYYDDSGGDQSPNEQNQSGSGTADNPTGENNNG